MAKSKSTIDAKKIVRHMKLLNADANNTGVIAFHSYGVHITERSMAQVAPLSEWRLNEHLDTELYPYKHTLVLDGVEFFALSSDKVTP